MMRVLDESCTHIFVALQARRIGLHFRFRLAVARPRCHIGVAWRIQMHLVAGDAREFATTKTRRCLYAVEFASRYSNHSIPPESVSEETRLGPANKIFLVTVIGRVWLHDKTLREIVSARTEAGAVAIEIYFIRHVIKGPNAVALTASER